jgi:hypothetical protein
MDKLRCEGMYHFDGMLLIAHDHGKMIMGESDVTTFLHDGHKRMQKRQ